MSKLTRPRDQAARAPGEPKVIRPSDQKSHALQAFEQGEVRLCVRVPEPMYRRLKSKLGAEGKKLQAYVLALLEEDLRQEAPRRGGSAEP